MAEAQRDERAGAVEGAPHALRNDDDGGCARELGLSVSRLSRLIATEEAKAKA